MNRRTAISSFIAFSNEANEDCFIEFPDDTAKDITIHGVNEVEHYIKRFLEEHNISLDRVNENANKGHRNELIAYLKLHCSLSIRDMSRILGVDRGVVARVKV
jgi:hypothetical protein